MSPIESILRDCGAAAGIGFWRFDATRGMVHWPRGFGPAHDDSYGSWWRLGEFGQAFDPAERARLFDYFENMFEPDRKSIRLELPVNSPNGPIQLRLEGKPLTGVEGLLAGGLVRDITRRHDAEDQARNLSQILDALMISVHAGVVVIDGKGHIRKANARAFRFLGIDLRDGDEAASLSLLEARMPESVTREVRQAQLGRIAASGALQNAPGLAEPITWAANPWGRGGMVLVLRAASGSATTGSTSGETNIAPAPAAAPEEKDAIMAAATERARALLDYVHHPCLVIQSRDASIDHANKAAREKLGLKPGVRTHINNLFELSGRHAPKHMYVTPERVKSSITLPMGARVSRMVDIDPDWLFVEYT